MNTYNKDLEMIMKMHDAKLPEKIKVRYQNGITLIYERNEDGLMECTTPELAKLIDMKKMSDKVKL